MTLNVTWWQRGCSTMAAVTVTMSDFPTYDGSGPPEDFFKQCTRLATLGGLPDEQLGAIIAARCQGRALSVVNGIEDSGCELSLSSVKAQLKAHFGSASGSVEQASQGLASLSKGHLSAQSYGLKVRQLVRQACPELFGEDGLVKKICVPSYNAALYRHFLVGLSSEERCLLSRQKASTFEQCLSELTREESLEAAEVTSAASAHRVRWDDLHGTSRDLASRQLSPVALGRSRGGSPGAGPRGSPVREQRRWGEPDDEDSERWERRSVTPERGRGSSPVAGRSPSDFHRWQGRSPDRDMESSGRRRRSPSRWDGPGWRPTDARRTGARSPAGSRSRERDRDAAPPGGGSSRRGGTRQPRAGSRASPGRTDGGRAARDISPDWDDCVEGRRSGIVRCWSCGGVGHIKRQCPNEFAGRRIRY